MSKGDTEHLQPVTKIGKIGFIGGGNMAKAICEGMVKKGLVKYPQVYVSGPHLDKLDYWSLRGAHTSDKNGAVVEEADIIFLTVKPHILLSAVDDIWRNCALAKSSDKLFISVLAGTTLEVLETALSKFSGARIIRVMPNTPLMVGEGCAVYCPGKHANEIDISIVESVFQASGLCQVVSENMINAFGALAGSGPAYIYLAIEAMSDAGVKLGISRDMATKFAAQTVLGAAKMVLETKKHPAALKDEVCSPGGTTIAGIHALERGGLRATLIDAVEAAAKRTEELQLKLKQS